MARAFLRPENRLHDRREFDRVFASPNRIGDRLLTMLVRANDLDYARLGLIVSKRVDKRAVGRNRIKRLIREGFRQHLSSFGGVDVVVIPKISAAAADNPELNSALERLWLRLAGSSE